jgi:1-acyl-sn-glycerol-3-phosphate acyltransferase
VTDRPSLEGIPQEQQSTAAGVLATVQDLTAELHPRRGSSRAVSLDSSLERDLGLDSLAKVELLSRIEKQFSVSMPEHLFADAESPRDIWQAVVGAQRGTTSRATHVVTPVKLADAHSAPHDARTLVDVLDWHVRAHPDRLHLRLHSDVGDGSQITYGELGERARRVAAGLQQRGLKHGERVAIMLPTGAEYFFAFYGTLCAGGVPVPIYPPMRLKQIEEHLHRHAAILTNCGAAILITIPEAKPLARLLKSRAQALQHLLTVDELSEASEPYQGASLKGEDIAFIQYTSGSTGHPKGVVLTHANLLANMRVIGDAFHIDDTDVTVSWLPLYHDMGLIGTCMCTLYYAVPLVLMSPLDFISHPERWLWAIHRYRCTMSAAPNFAYEYCLRKLSDDDIAGLDLSSWRIACNGAEPVSPDTMERFCERFAPYGFRREAMKPVYGLAECSLAVSFPPLGRAPVVDAIDRGAFMHSGRAEPAPPGDTNVLRFVACGRPLPGHEVRIVDGAGRELPERHEGHLQFRGPSATSGYFRNPDATRHLFHGDWLDSGDRAYVAEGDLYITGRTKDIIIRAGRNIYPSELEEAAGNVPGVRRGNVVVFGRSDPATNLEQMIVVAETREKDPQALERIRAEINAMAVDLVGIPPDDVVLTPPRTLLKTSSGKIRRAANRELYERGQISKGEKAIWWQMTRLAVAAMAPELRRAAGVVGSFAYGLYTWLLLVLAAPFVWPLVVLLPRLSARWAVARAAVRLLASATGIPITVSGLDRVPSTGACVFVANHASYLDSFVLASILPRPATFVAKVELTKHIGTRLLLQRLETEFVERFDKQRGIEDARRIGHRAKEGRTLIFYPEGALKRMPGLHAFHMGAFVAAAEAGVPIVPIAIRGSRSILRPGTRLPRRGAVTVTIGEAVSPADVATQQAPDSWTTATVLSQLARERIARYCGEPDLTS